MYKNAIPFSLLIWNQFFQSMEEVDVIVVASSYHDHNTFLWEFFVNHACSPSKEKT